MIRSFGKIVAIGGLILLGTAIYYAQSRAASIRTSSMVAFDTVHSRSGAPRRRSDSAELCKRAFAKYESTLKPDRIAAHRKFHRYHVYTFYRDPGGDGALIRFQVAVPGVYGGGALVWVDENGTETILKRYV